VFHSDPPPPGAPFFTTLPSLAETGGAAASGSGHGGAALAVKVTPGDFTTAVTRAVALYERDVRTLGLHLHDGCLRRMAEVSLRLSRPGGHAMMCGRAGAGRRSAVGVMAFAAGVEVVEVGRSQTAGSSGGGGGGGGGGDAHGGGGGGGMSKGLKTELRALLERAGVAGEKVVLYVEDFQLGGARGLLEAVGALVIGGEVPGLYTAAEMDAVCAPLREEYSELGWEGNLHSLFAHKVRANLRVVLAMDTADPLFEARCRSNPALFAGCSVHWWDTWTDDGMRDVPKHLLADILNGTPDPTTITGTPQEVEAALAAAKAASLEGFPDDRSRDQFLSLLGFVHSSRLPHGATPRQFLALLETFRSIHTARHGSLSTNQSHLRAGLSKLADAESRVDALGAEAVAKRSALATAQADADAALANITASMSRAGERKQEVEQLRSVLEVEEGKLRGRKGEIERELEDVSPLLEASARAVGEIRMEQINEVRSLRAPPAAIAHILEAVLSLMGINDLTWSSMRKFLGNRGVLNDILNFDARSITPKVRAGVESVIRKNAASFEPATARKASLAAAPLAAWAQAQLKYASVLEKIAPLERDLAKAEGSLKSSRDRVAQCESELAELTGKVDSLKAEFGRKTETASELKHELKLANATLEAAQTLLGKLSGEKERWVETVKDLTIALRRLPTSALLAAAFIVYLSDRSEDERERAVAEWRAVTAEAATGGGGGANGSGGGDDDRFRFNQVMSTESQQLQWKAEGLPSDALSIENANAILNCTMVPLIIDPASQAVRWLERHFADSKVKTLVASDPRFARTLEIAVRFGETLLVTEVDHIDPVLYPLLRRDLYKQGPRLVVHLGDKAVDYNDTFRLFLVTRNPTPSVPPSAASVLTVTNFSVTRSGLESQLLALTIRHERPELETRKLSVASRFFFWF
jgi:dynein heavy chain 2